MNEKIEQLLSQMTLEEKISMLAGADLWYTVPVERLGIPAIKVTDGPNGARGAFGSVGPPSACFPVGIALAATWNPELIRQIGKALGEETRAKGAHILLAPTVNIHRSPLAGRSFECYSEDPYLTSQMAVAYIKGVQSQGVGACIKHFVCNDSEYERMSMSSEVAERPLREIYLKPFEVAIREAKPWAVMSAYNRINGVYASENTYTLREILKGEWGFDGMVMSDWGGTYSENAANGGLDLEMPGPGLWMIKERLLKAMQEGKVSEGVIDDKVRRLLRTIMRAGAFENPELHPEQAIDKPEHRTAALEAASESIVLLKNENAVLPLNLEKLKHIAVIGSNAKWAQIMGGGSSTVTPHYKVSPLEGIRNLVGEAATVEYALGCPIHRSLPPIEASWLTQRDEKSLGLSIELFDNTTLAGEAVATTSTDRPGVTWTDEMLQKVDSTKFSARLTGQFIPPESGAYAFSLEGVGRTRLFIDGRLILDNWPELPPGTPYWSNGQVTGKMRLTAGKPYQLKIEVVSETTSPWRNLQIGCLPPIPDDPIQEAVNLAKKSDVVILFAGTTNEWESEGHDRQDMELPGDQVKLIEQVVTANPNTVVILNTGAPVSMDWLEKVPAVAQAWFAGQEAGNAIAAVLFGEVNPSGKLPTTFPKRLKDNPAYINYPGENGKVYYGEGLFVGYRYYEMKDIEPSFPFGHGFSYTTFEYKNLAVSASKYEPGDEIQIRVDITNTGEYAGKEVVQLYLRDVESSLVRPNKELKAFAKVMLSPGETQTVTFTLDRESLAFYHPAREAWVTEAGDFEVLIGSSSGDIRLVGKFGWSGDPKIKLDTDDPRHIGLPLNVLLDDEPSKAVLETHIFVLEWEPGEIRWYVDGERYQTQNAWFTSSDWGAYPAPFDQPFHLVLNIAVGGARPGYPDQTTEFPQYMIVDYVRVYQKDDLK